MRGCSGLDGGQDGVKGAKILGGSLTALYRHKLASDSWTNMYESGNWGPVISWMGD